jgi:hypothetical protein
MAFSWGANHRLSVLFAISKRKKPVNTGKNDSNRLQRLNADLPPFNRA